MRLDAISWQGGIAAATMFALAVSAPAVPNARLRNELETAISRRVARDSGGRIYLLGLGADREGRSEARLSIGPPGAECLADFAAPIDCLGSLAAGESIRAAGLAIDGRDRLHLVWSTATGRTEFAIWDMAGVGSKPVWLNPANGRRGSLVLAEKGSIAGDITVAPEGTVWITWTTSDKSHRSELLVGTVRDGRWRAASVARGYGYFPASLRLREHGDFDLGWNDIYETSWILSGGALGADPPPAPLAVPGRGYRPVMAGAIPAPIAVREDQLNQLDRFFLDGSPPRLVSLSRSPEDRRFAWDTLHSPQFATDRYGTPWLFFIDSARQHVFYTRWLGGGWGPIGTAGKLTWNSGRFEDNHLPVDRIAVEQRQAAGDFGLLLENDTLTPGAEFFRVPVPHLSAEPGKKILFLDLEELASLDGLTLALNPPRKAGPVIETGPPGAFDASRIGPPLRVLRENGIYRMWYAGGQPVVSGRWWEAYHAGYAESADGRAFHRVNLRLETPEGGPQGNMIPGIGHSMPALFYDRLELDPQRRYKLLYFKAYGAEDEDEAAGFGDPWSERLAGKLMVSPDGIHWRAIVATMDFPGGRPFELIPQSMFRDSREGDSGKRFKAYGFSSLNLGRRGGGYAYSADAIHWTACAENPVLDPFAGATPPVRGGKVEQIHDTVVWPAGDYYLALYQYQHDGEFLDLRLAMSRDGKNFTPVRPEQAFLSGGRPGEWDCDQVNPSPPLAEDGEIKIYYGAVHFEGGVESSRVPSQGGVGLATLRVDGYTDLEPSAGRVSASFETIPIRPGRSSELLVNADCGKGTLQVEIVDPATGRSLPGYSREDCIPMAGDSTAGPVHWTSHSGITGLRREFQLRFFFNASASEKPKLFSFSFR